MKADQVIFLVSIWYFAKAVYYVILVHLAKDRLKVKFSESLSNEIVLGMEKALACFCVSGMMLIVGLIVQFFDFLIF